MNTELTLNLSYEIMIHVAFVVVARIEYEVVGTAETQQHAREETGTALSTQQITMSLHLPHVVLVSRTQRSIRSKLHLLETRSIVIICNRSLLRLRSLG
jgi:hypothetical protein